MRKQHWESDDPAPTKKLTGYNIGDIHKNDKYKNIYYMIYIPCNLPLVQPLYQYKWPA